MGLYSGYVGIMEKTMETTIMGEGFRVEGLKGFKGFVVYGV